MEGESSRQRKLRLKRNIAAMLYRDAKWPRWAIAEALEIHPHTVHKWFSQLAMLECKIKNLREVEE